jgi:hypothetical protein
MTEIATMTIKEYIEIYKINLLPYADFDGPAIAACWNGVTYNLACGVWYTFPVYGSSYCY